MKIVLVRIDDRLIHGQVATIWVKTTDCQRIIVCDDKVATDIIHTTLLKQIAPKNIKVDVVTINEISLAYKNSKYGNEKCLLLFTNPESVLEMVKNGVDIKSINVGGMSFKEGKHQITDSVFVDDKDIEAFKKLNAYGIEIEYRKVDVDERINLMKFF